MIRKIKLWWKNRKLKRGRKEVLSPSDKVHQTERYSAEQLDAAYAIGYNDGRRDGLTIAREQASNSLKEILWQQNKSPKK